MGTRTEDHPAIAAREAAIATYQTTFASLEEAKSKGNKKAVLSLGAKLANRSREIRELRCTLAEDGVVVPAFAPPKTSRNRKQPPMAQPELEAKLGKAAGVYHADVDEELKHTADVRIQALLKVAQKAGYSIKDPRKR